jgi:hypothetical protein
LGASNHHNRTNVLTLTIDETSSEVKLIGVGVIGFELFEQISEFLNVFRDYGSVFDME